VITRFRRVLFLCFLVSLFASSLLFLSFPPRDSKPDACPVAKPTPAASSRDTFRVDTDRDGIEDGVEIAHDADIFGTNPANWPDPNHADIYLELDTQEGYLAPLEVKRGAVDFYAQVGFCNPDGTEGIRLHIDDASPEFYFGGGQIFKNESQELYPQLTMMDRYDDANSFSPKRCGIFRYGLVLRHLAGFASEFEAAGLGDSPGDTLYVAGESLMRNYEFGTVVIVHEVGHNIWGQLDEINWDNDDKGHDPYGDFLSYRTFGSKLWVHANMVAELQRDGLLGLPRRCR